MTSRSAPSGCSSSAADRTQTVSVDLPVAAGELLVDLFDARSQRAAAGTRRHEIRLEPYGYHWYRVGVVDNALYRAALGESPSERRPPQPQS